MTHHLRALPLTLLASLLSLAVLPAAEPDRPKPKHTNRLAKETSPYLLQHAHNPVDWYPWGPDAFARAKKEGKLIFLSIGYSSCHWCHVMERESFENEEIAKILNRDFVCIKVDREERPDIDHIYLTALSVMNQQGGWPLSMFLTADGKPIFGGTYWPPEDKDLGDDRKIRGFKTVLSVVQKAYADKPDEITKHADKVAETTRDALASSARGIPLIDLDRELITGAVDGVKERFDSTHGGFGSPARKFAGTKFPTPPILLLLHNEATRTKAKDLKEMLHLTLDHMAQGGIYDQLGGGFHRYSTERTWTVPHFEKMLYDNAQLCEVYALAYADTKKPLYKRVLQQTLAFVERELTNPDGGFYSALDADSEGEEGKFYVWTVKEIDTLLAGQADAKIFKQVYGLDDAANFESKYHILVLKKPLADHARELKTTEADLDRRLGLLRQKLFEARAKRPRPFLDTKVVTGWNGQMIAGAALAGQALGEKKRVEMAAKAADFVLKNLRTKDGRLLRTWGAAPGQKAEARLNGYLDDYAYLVHGLLTLHDVSGEARWLDEARALTDVMLTFHADKDVGAFFFTSNDHEKLFARAKDQFDGAQPSGNSVAARNLVRLFAKTKDEKYNKEARKTFKALAAPLKMEPGSLTGLADALGMYLDLQKK
jgi:uncharacterized protein YyaL (SSP411 family)